MLYINIRPGRSTRIKKNTHTHTRSDLQSKTHWGLISSFGECVCECVCVCVCVPGLAGVPVARGAPHAATLCQHTAPMPSVCSVTHIRCMLLSLSPQSADLPRCAFLRVSVCVSVCLCLRVSVCVCVCVCVCVFVFRIWLQPPPRTLVGV